MYLQFWGAARTVTGSAHLLIANNKRVLVDCGLSQGQRQLAREMNQQFPVQPNAMDAMLLTHAHIDHSGNIPQLVKRGFRKTIHCTPATMDLTRVLLRDSGHIQELDAEFLNRRQKNHKNGQIVQPLYTMLDAEQALPYLKPTYYDTPVEVLSDGSVTAVFRDAGHILGSAFVEVAARENGTEKKIIFSGDVGRKNMPILRDPAVPNEADALVLESTYGTRKHQEYAAAKEKLCDALNRVVKRGGKVVVPSFSMERTQELVYALNNLWNDGRLERVPVYVDSPLSVNVTEVFRHHPECYNDDIKQVFLNDPDPFGFESLTYVRDTESSKRINRTPGPCIIISASGMCEAGRVLHHLANNIGDSRNAVFIVGFQAENTLGRKLVDKLPEVKILGEMHKVAAEVVVFNAFSAHADCDELREFARNAAASGRLKKIFLVHGEEEVITAFQQTLAADLPQCEILAPERGKVYPL